MQLRKAKCVQRNSDTKMEELIMELRAAIAKITSLEMPWLMYPILQLAQASGDRD
jgi:hypothetical protein